MLESEYKRNIREALHKLGAKTIPIVTGSLTEKGTPDILGVYKGRCFVIEAKILPNFPSDIQKTRLREWEHSGAMCFIFAYPKHDIEFICAMVRMYYKNHNYSTLSSTMEDLGLSDEFMETSD